MTTPPRTFLRVEELERRETPTAVPSTVPVPNYLHVADAAWQPTATPKYQAPVAFLGDSIFDAYDLIPYSTPGQVPFIPVTNLDLGTSGNTTSNVLWQLAEGELNTTNPQVTVILIGTNNLVNSYTPYETAQGVAAVVNAVRTIQPHSQVLLLGVLPRGQEPDTPLRQEISDTNAMISQLDDHNMVRYLDIGSAYLNPDGTIPQSLMSDYVHPNVLGYEVMTQAIAPALFWMLGHPPSGTATPPAQTATANAALPSLSSEQAAPPTGGPASSPQPANAAPPAQATSPPANAATINTTASADAPAAEKPSLDLTALTEALWFTAITAPTVTH
jgi:beta-glucosidase